MAKKKAPEPAVRKSFLITGGVAVGAAVLGFVLMNFLGGGGGGDEAPTELATLGGATIPIASAAPVGGGPGSDPIELTPGGRDPFISKAPPSPSSASSAPSVSSSSSAVAATAVTPAPAPVTYVPPPAVVQPVSQPAPQPAPAAQPAPQPAPQPTPRPVYPKQTITVLAVYGKAADIQIDDTVFEGAHANDELTERFNLDGFSGTCFFMKDMFPPDSQTPERFKLCADDSVTR